jgi:hypothetical protein
MPPPAMITRLFVTRRAHLQSNEFHYRLDAGWSKFNIPRKHADVSIGSNLSVRREVAPTARGQCDLRTVFPKEISGLRKPIAIQAAISLTMNLPE